MALTQPPSYPTSQQATQPPDRIMISMSPRLSLALAATLAAIFIAGCGGGGGGGNGGGGAVVYRTVWNGGATPPLGESQRIALYNSAGGFVGSRIINQDQSEATFTGLSSGQYRLFAQLNSAPNFGGVITGQLETIVTVNSTALFESSVGSQIASVRVLPESSTITVQQTQQFTATALNAQGLGVFVAPGSIDWDANGGVATVSQEGIALGTNEGTGSIVATHTPSGFSDAAVLTVNAFTITQSKWTVLVYLNAANDLNEFGDLNFNQMERVAGNANVRFVVQWKQAFLPSLSPDPSFEGTRRYLASQDTTDQIRSQLIQDMGMGVDMGAASTLQEFVEWGKTYFPADRTVLVVWNHGNGWRRKIGFPDPTRGVSYDDETGNSIDTWELASALGPGQVDILAWDASLMQMMEVNYEIRTKAELIVGSEESPPGAGYPYDEVFDNFLATPDAATLDLAKSFVDATLLVPEYASQKITQSVISSSDLPGLATAIDALAGALIAEKLLAQPGFNAYVQAARDDSQSYSPSTTRHYRDLHDLTLELDQAEGVYTPPAAILAANQGVRNALASAILYEGHNFNSPDSHGISIDFSPAFRFSSYAGDYAQLQIAGATRWDEWLTVAP